MSAGVLLGYRNASWRRAIASSAVRGAEDIAVAAADPLFCDRFFATEFVSLNRDRATSDLSLHAMRAAHIALTIDPLTRTDALAALRDLGMITAALVRAGGDEESLSQPRFALARMGHFAGEVPRDTVFSYGPRNPCGARERHFTDTTDERAFISSFRQGVKATAASIDALVKACHMSLDDSDFPATIDASIDALRQVVDIMIRVQSEVRAEVFTREIRSFFEIIAVEGRKYVAPGGAQVPLLAIDMMVWADRIPQLQLYRYLRENVDYYPQSYRELIEDLEGRPSLLQRLEARRRERRAGRATRAVNALITQLVRFRYPHRKVARDNMRLRAYGSYQADVLDQLLENTVAARQRVKALAGSTM